MVGSEGQSGDVACELHSTVLFTSNSLGERITLFGNLGERVTLFGNLGERITLFGNLGERITLFGGGPTPFLYTHLVYIWQKSDGHVH